MNGTDAAIATAVVAVRFGSSQVAARSSYTAGTCSLAAADIAAAGVSE